MMLAAALVAAMATTAARTALADRVTLGNGDRLTGKVLRLGKDKLTLETKYAGRVEIRRQDVAAIEADEPIEVLRRGDAALSRMRGTIPLSEVAFVNPTPEQSGIGVGYTGRFTLSVAQVRGNSESATSVGDFALEARAKRWRAALALDATQAEESGRETASNWLANGSLDRFVDPRRFYYGRASVERDRFSGVELRSTLGAGYGVQLRDGDRTQASLRGGIEAVSLHPVDGARDDHPAFGWGLRYRHKVLAERAEIFHEQDGYWNLERTSDITVRTRTGLRAPLIDKLNASLQLNVDWEHDPEPGRDATDSTLLLGLGYAW
jgi:putative salt-induced outer membrane protein YdiY